jgi:hypothetical protein
VIVKNLSAATDGPSAPPAGQNGREDDLASEVSTQSRTYSSLPNGSSPLMNGKGKENGALKGPYADRVPLDPQKSAQRLAALQQEVQGLLDLSRDRGLTLPTVDE